ncbi:MAG TPA: glycosyl hydrolase [Microvirga sp.]|jgi:hypothetical protein|nr:glycosyl hydrolase [Microvirga sp.]
MTIDHPEKIGLGIWDKDALGSALNDVDRVGFGWHYNWSERALWDADATPEQSSYVAMAWDEQDVTAAALASAKASGATTLLGFNEPDHAAQANMSVEQALALWPQLQATGLRLGSPAATQHQTLGSESWLGRFMAGAQAQGLRVDFIAVHYYSDTADVGAFKAFLEAVHAQYGKPVWVTEWALADWSNPGRFSVAQQAAFARAGAEMMDDLAFVERHAWFAAYEGGDGWHLNSGVMDASGQLTAVGRVFDSMTKPGSGSDTGGPVVESPAADSPLTLVGTSGADTLVGKGGSDTLKGLAGADQLSGGEGSDTLIGGKGKDVLRGAGGADTYDFNAAKDSVTGSKRDVVMFSHAEGDVIDLSGIDASTQSSGNQTFRWVDADDLNAEFTKSAGQLRLEGGLLQGDTDGDGRADFELVIKGAITPDDFIL